MRLMIPAKSYTDWRAQVIRVLALHENARSYASSNAEDIMQTIIRFATDLHHNR